MAEPADMSGVDVEALGVGAKVTDRRGVRLDPCELVEGVRRFLVTVIAGDGAVREVDDGRDIPALGEDPLRTRAGALERRMVGALIIRRKTPGDFRTCGKAALSASKTSSEKNVIWPL